MSFDTTASNSGVKAVVGLRGWRRGQ